jgi:hypothetical protein
MPGPSIKHSSETATEQLAALRSAPELLHAVLAATCQSIEFAASLRMVSERGDAFDAWGNGYYLALVESSGRPTQRAEERRASAVRRA